MNDDERDEYNAEAAMERPDRLELLRRLRKRSDPVWRNATVEAMRSERQHIERQEEIEEHRRAEEYAS